MFEKLKKIIFGGGNLDDENKELLDSLSKDELINLLKKEREEKEIYKKKLEKIKNKDSKTIDEYTESNLKNWINWAISKDKEHLNPEVLQYDEHFTSFDKTIINDTGIKYRVYQKKFIEDWTISTTELVILYYGVGSGKTIISLNCAEQFLGLNPESFVYFVIPASLVLNTIKSMYAIGIDPRRKNKDGEYVYKFISYQQLQRSKINIKPRSLLIIDEAHNLRNFQTKEVKDKISARKWKKTDNYSLVGNKVAELLLKNKNTFLRSIFLTGTLLCNSPDDIEALIAIGYKRSPLIQKDRVELEIIQSEKNSFDKYYGGLVSFFRLSDKDPLFPKKKYKFIGIKSPKGEYEKKDDSFFYLSRNDGMAEKVKWIIKFLSKKKNEKTLIYAEFINRSIQILMRELKKKDIEVVEATGNEGILEKQTSIDFYNENKVKILVFSKAIKEGISFKETNNFIFMQPYWNYAIIEQIIARGIRLDSHKAGQKSTVNVYLLVNTDDDKTKEFNEWIKNADKIMNDNIKTLIYPIKKEKNKEGKEFTVVQTRNSDFSRDTYIWDRVFNKQESINRFEKQLLEKKLSFEDYLNNENNEFIQKYNLVLEDLKKEKGRISRKEEIEIKKKMYKEDFETKINNTNKLIIRFDKDSNYSENRNPDLQTTAQNNYKGDEVYSKLKKMIIEKDDLTKIFNSFNIDKQQITNFQANFTTKDNIDIIIKESGIENNLNDKLFILEPTSGVGGIIIELLKCKNRQNFMIDSNEFHNVFYNMQKIIFENLSNVFVYNLDFLYYSSKYNYDYIFGNPPFTLRTREKKITNKTIKIGEGENEKEFIDKITSYKDITLYDVNFVERAYNMLKNPTSEEDKDGGILSMIISDRFMNDDPHNVYIKRFKYIIQKMTERDDTSVKIIKTSSFVFSSEKDKGTQNMTTKFPMVCIVLRRLYNHYIDLEKDITLKKDKKPEEEEEEEEELKDFIKKDKLNKEKLKTQVKPIIIKRHLKENNETLFNNMIKKIRKPTTNKTPAKTTNKKSLKDIEQIVNEEEKQPIILTTPENKEEKKEDIKERKIQKKRREFTDIKYINQERKEEIKEVIKEEEKIKEIDIKNIKRVIKKDKPIKDKINDIDKKIDKENDIKVIKKLEEIKTELYDIEDMNSKELLKNIEKNLDTFNKNKTETEKIINNFKNNYKQGAKVSKKEFNKYKKDLAIVKNKQATMNGHYEELLSSIVELQPYIEYNDYAKLKRQAEPIYKKIEIEEEKRQPIHNEIDDLEGGSFITIINSGNKKSFDEQLRKAQEDKDRLKELNKDKIAKLKDELSDIKRKIAEYRNDPILVKIDNIKNDARSKISDDLIKSIQEQTFKITDLTIKPQLKGEGVIDTIKTLFTGRKDFPPDVRKFINLNKDLTITHFKIGRKPITSFITTIGNWITRGRLKEEMKKKGYDELFHLWLEFTLSNGRSYLTEKDEIIKISNINNRDSDKTNYLNVPAKNIVNVYDFFYKPLKGQGVNLLRYSAHKYNCQDYVMNLLKYSNNLTPENEKFIMQNVSEILEDPYFSLHKTIIQKFTDLGATVDILKQGAGRKKRKIKKN